MATQEDVNALEQERERKEDEDKDNGNKDKKPEQTADAEMKDTEEKAAEEEEEKEENIIDEEVLRSSTQDVNMRRRLLENDLRIMKSEHQRLTHEKAAMNEKIKDNLDKIENNRYGCLQYESKD